MLQPTTQNFGELQATNFYQCIRSTKTERKDFTKEKLNKYIGILLADNPKDPLDYYVRRRFAVKKYMDKYVLIDKKEEHNTSIKRYLYKEEIFDVIKTAHVNCLHGGIKKTYGHCRMQAANIKINHIKAYLAVCDICRENKEKKKKESSTCKKIHSSDFGERGQADLIDIRKLLLEKGVRDRKYSFVLVYQDHFTKFCFLRGLRKKNTTSVIDAFSHIFSIIGAPRLLQTDNGGEFVGKAVCQYMESSWPDVTLIRGSPYHPQSQGSVERANGHIKRLLQAFFSHTQTMQLVNVLETVQFVKNTEINRSLGVSPYEKLFGRKSPTIQHLQNHLAMHCDDEVE